MATSVIVVVSGSYGAGHDAAADALADELRLAGQVVRRLDVARELPWRLGVFLRWLYFTQLRLLPGSWGATLRWLEGDGFCYRAVRRALSLLGRSLVHEVAGARLIVSTHPFASQALGEARARGQLDVPVVTYLTDASVHRLWVHPSVDLHLAIHALTAQQSRDLGGVTTVVQPVVSGSAGLIPADWRPPWPAGAAVALVVGGSCGVGDLQATALEILATGLMTPVVACGTNDRLSEQIASVPGLVALGWRDDMTALVAAATCVVQNAGGMTSLESLAAATPTVTYRPIPGHGTANARALHDAGLVPWVADPAQLRSTLERVLRSPECFSLPSGAPRAIDVMAAHGLLELEPVLAAA
jgi:processive 1,2-diacylglycerol beta-glucosyltransferase